MCGRFAFYSPTEAVARLFNVAVTVPIEPRYNIAPTQYVAAVVHGDAGRELVMLRWGLVPFWAKDPAIGNRMINARAETVAEKPAYRDAYRKRRCLVLADGFYEWQRHDGAKTPWYISRSDGEAFAFAGLWESWRDPASEQSLRSTTIVTRPANAFMEQLHHRMPVLVRPDAASRWLAGDMDFLEHAGAGAPTMRAWPVARTVNNARNEGRHLIDAAGSTLVEQ
ncbi:MAG TPA: SOS response-associated peptidase [Woeseiaceae bacterium]|nr:SOS response-associated peptidase [Woeseiaceae bacterium]